MKDNNEDRFYNSDIDDFEEFDKNEVYDNDNLSEAYDENAESYDDEPQFYDDDDFQDVEDGYDEQYYDDRLSKVLDELADLKRGMSPQGHSQASANDGALYNEISRLREELNKTQNTQNLNTELARLKEELQRDKKTNESSFLAEIKRLNKRVESLKKDVPALESPKPRYNISNNGISGSDFSKLVSINESILHSTHDMDSKVQNQINGLKTKLEALPNFNELNSAVESIKNSAKNLEQRPETINDKLADGVNSLCLNLGESGFSAAAEVGEKLIAKLNMLNNTVPNALQNSPVDLSQISKAIFELKGMIGSDDPLEIENLNKNINAYEQIDKLNALITSNASYKEKLLQVNSFLKINRASAYNQEVISLIKNMVNKLLSEQLTKNNYEGFLSFGLASGEFTISEAKKDSINKYIAFTQRIATENCNVLIDILPELVSVIVDILNPNSSFDYISIQNSINAKLSQLENATDEQSVQNICSDLIRLFEKFCCIKISDTSTYTPVFPKLSVSNKHINAGDALADKLNSIKSQLDNLSLSTLANDSAESKQILKEVSALKEIIVSNQMPKKAAEVIENSRILQKIDTLLNGEADKASARQKMLEDLSLITKKLEDQDFFINQIVDLRADVLNTAPQNIDLAPQIKKLSEDLIDQLNKINSSIVIEINSLKAKINYSILKEQPQSVLAPETTRTVLVSDVKDEKITTVKEDFSKIAEDVAFIRSQIEANIDTGAYTLEDAENNGNFSGIVADISAIKDKLNTLDEYDTVAEILSLREDVKASKIVNSNDVSTELEGIKTEITEIKNELFDLKAISNEISRSNPQTTSEAVQTSNNCAATSDEINMLLGEIVSLRDEIQSYKDDVNNIMTVESDNKDGILPREDENITVILDELTGLRSELQGFKEDANSAENTEIKDGISEIKNLISRRTTLAETENTNNASNELNIVLDQIVDLKNEIDALKQDFALSNYKDELLSIKDLVEENNAKTIQTLKNENLRLTEQMQSFKDDLLSIFTAKMQEFVDTSTATLNLSAQNANAQPDTTVLTEVLSLHDDVNNLSDYINSNQELEMNDTLQEIRNDVSSIKNDEPDLTIINEILALREEFQAFKDELNKANSANKLEKSSQDVLNEVRLLKDQLTQTQITNNSLQDFLQNDNTKSEIAATIEQSNSEMLDQIAKLKQELSEANNVDDATAQEQTKTHKKKPL